MCIFPLIPQKLTATCFFLQNFLCTFSQMGQLCLQSPSPCVHLCLRRSPELMKALPQSGWSHAKGLSPVCDRIWVFSRSALKNPYKIYLNFSFEYALNNSISKLVWKIKDEDPQSTRKKVKSYIFRTNVFALACFNYWFLTLSQWSHWYGFVGWWVIKCSFRWLACVYVFSHLSHLNGRSPVCCLKNNDFKVSDTWTFRNCDVLHVRSLQLIPGM